MTPEKWKKYLELPASETMESSKIDYRIDNAISRIPTDVENTLCIGVGDGYELSKIKNSIGIDINVESLKICKDKGLNIQEGDMHDIPFQDKSFDLVFARHVLEHSIATWIAMTEITRVSRKYVMIILPDEKIWGESDWHFLIPTRNQIKLMAKKLNFIPVSIWHNDLSGEGKNWAVEDGYLLKRL